MGYFLLEIIFENFFLKNIMRNKRILKTRKRKEKKRNGKKLSFFFHFPLQNAKILHSDFSPNWMYFSKFFQKFLNFSLNK